MASLRIIFSDLKNSKIAFFIFVAILAIVIAFGIVNKHDGQHKSAEFIVLSGLASMALLRKSNSENRAALLQLLPISRKRSYFIQFAQVFIYPVATMLFSLIILLIAGFKISFEYIAFLVLASFVFINFGAFMELESPHISSNTKDKSGEYKKLTIQFTYATLGLLALFALSLLYSFVNFNYFTYIMKSGIYLPLGLFSIWCHYKLFSIIRDKTDLIEYQKHAKKNYFWYFAKNKMR